MPTERIYIKPLSPEKYEDAYKHDHDHDKGGSFIGTVARYATAPVLAIMTAKEAVQYVATGFEAKHLDDIAAPSVSAFGAYKLGEIFDTEVRETCYHAVTGRPEGECDEHGYPFYVRLAGDATGIAAGVFEATQIWDLFGNYNLNQVDDALYVPAALIGTKALRGAMRVLQRR